MKCGVSFKYNSTRGSEQIRMLLLKDVVLDVLKRNIEKCGNATGVLIEGFPRTREQAQQYNDLVSTSQ